MKSIKGLIIIILVLFVSILPVLAQEDTKDKSDFHPLTGPYIGQKPPGMTPVIFAPGIVSTGMDERSLTMTPDGNEFYYTIMFNGCHFIVMTKYIGGRWTSPEIAHFSGQYSDTEPCIHPDGSRFFFISKRPLDTISVVSEIWNIWYMDRESDGWSKPKPIGSPINFDADVLFPSVTKMGTLYFIRRTETGGEEIYRSEHIDEEYQKPERLPNHINAEHQQGNAWISPDESFLIVCTKAQEDSREDWDYFVTFRKDSNEWSELINLGNKINTDRDEYTPSLSSDGKYFFFQRSGNLNRSFTKPIKYSDLIKMFNDPGYRSEDIYWVDAKIIEKLKPKELPKKE